MEHGGVKWSKVEQNGTQPIQCRFFVPKNDSTKQEYEDVEYILLILWWLKDWLNFALYNSITTLLEHFEAQLSEYR